MLVSSIARFQAAAGASDASFAMMMGANSLMSLVRNSQAFGDLSALQEADKRLTMDMQTNSLLYKLYTLQEKMWKKQQDDDIKRSFSAFA